MSEDGGFLGGAISAVGNYLGVENTNRTNKKIADNANKLSYRMMKENMAFQKLMSGTARRRDMMDLKKAGLNPLLAATGGASTPSGAMGSVIAPTMENAIGAGFSSAMEAGRYFLDRARQKEEINLMKTQGDKNKMETKVMSKGVPEAEFKNEIYDIIRPMVKKIKESVQSGSKKVKPGKSVTQPPTTVIRGGMR